METTTINLEVQSNLEETVSTVDQLSNSLNSTEQGVVDVGTAATTAGNAINRMGQRGSQAMEQTTTRAQKAEAAIMTGVQATNLGVQAFTAYQGAVALTGVESEELQKTMMKVQGAMALAQGIQGIIEAGKQMTTFGKTAMTALQGVKGAVMATGIGLLVVAIGTLVAYWDDIKAAVSGVSAEQERLNQQAQKNVEVQQKKLDTIGAQENILKLQGKSEKEILQIKLKQTDEAIKAMEVQIENSEATMKAQVDAAERNKQITKGIIMFLTAPLQMILGTIDLVTEGLAYIGVLENGLTLRDDMNEWAAELIFDPAETKAEGEKVIQEQKDALLKLQNDRAGLQLNLNNIDAQGAKTRTEQAKAEAEAGIEIQRRLWDLRAEMTKDGYQKEVDAVKEKYRRELQDIMANEKYNANQKKLLKEQLLLNESYELGELEKAEAQRKEELRRRIFDLEVETIKDTTERELAINKEKYERLRADILKDEEITGEEKLKLVKYYADQEAFEKSKIEMVARQKGIQDELKYQQIKSMILEDELRDIEKNGAEKLKKFLELQSQKVDQAQLERDQALADVTLTESQKALIIEEYNNKVRDIEFETAEYKKTLDKEVADKRKEILDETLNQIQQGLQLITDITEFSTEQQTNAINKKYDKEKAAAEGNLKAQNKIEARRIQDLNKANKRAFNIKKAADIASATIDGYKSVLSTFANTPGGVGIKTVAATLAGVFSALNIAKIASAKFEGATFEPQEPSGGGGDDAGAGGTISPNFNIVGDSGINQLATANQQPMQAYVVSQNVTSAQALDRERVETATL